MTPVGRTLKTARTSAGLSQAELGAACNLSQKQISRFECGTKIPDEAETRLLARALNIDPAVLAHGTAGTKRDTSPLRGGENEDDVRRRALLAAGIGIGATALPTTSPEKTPDWDKALFTHGRSSTLTANQLTARLDCVASDLTAARYEQAERALPPLIHAAKGTARYGSKAGAEILARTWVLATAVSVKERRDESWLTSAWATEAAQRAQHPLAHAMAARAQYICLRQHGHHQRARMVADTAVDELSGEERARPVLGHLLLEAAYGAAQSGRASDAVSLWEHARSLARKGPAAAAWPDHPGPLTTQQVERYGMCIHHVLGDSRRALHHMAALDAESTNPHTVARIRHDSAKLYRDLGNMPEALRLLQKLAEAAPQDAQRSSVRGMVTGMLQTSPALPGLRPFASEIGAL
jgi:transcriptional regulator with XRE-family HTH domain